MILCLCLLSGCTCEYNLLVTNKKKIYENIVIMDQNDNILKYSDSVEEFLLNQKKGIDMNEYAVNDILNKDSTGLKIKNTYSSFENYIKSDLFTSLFESANISEDNNIFSFETTGDYTRNNIFSNDISSDYLYDLDQITIKIQFYNKVISHNADEVDEKNNIYTWNIKRDTDYENIKFVLDNEIRYDVMIKDYISRNMLTIVVFIGIIIAIIIFVNHLLGIMKKNNSI